MALTAQTMTDEKRKSVALEYLKAFDIGGVTSSGGSIMCLLAGDAQVYLRGCLYHQPDHGLRGSRHCTSRGGSPVCRRSFPA
jgi:hypothetical protein